MIVRDFSATENRELNRREDFELYLQALTEKNYIQVEKVEKRKRLIYISPYTIL